MYQKLNGKKDGLTRTNSICPTPESVLLELVINNDTDNITRLITSRRSLLDHIYKPEYNKPILLIAVSEDGINANTVETLIDLGANIHYSSEIDEEWEALHFAACATDSDKLKVLVNRLTGPGEINVVAKGNSALHVLIKHGRSDLDDEFAKCAEVLIKAGIDVNMGDSNCVSAILWAAKRGYKNIITVILEQSIIDVDIDTHLSRRKTARDIILSEHLYDGVLPDKSESLRLNDQDILFTYLKSNNEIGFLNYKNGDIFHLVDLDDSSTTLLQLACNKGLKRCVEQLIDKGANPNKITDKNRKTPLEITAENGYYEIFEILLKHPKIKIHKDVLITLLKYIDNDQFPEINHHKCYKILINKMRSDNNLLDINEADHVKNTPLHYAIRYANSEVVNELLSLNASLGAKNRYGLLPVQDMEPELLEKHLDSCIQFDLKGKKFDREDFPVTYNYNTLIPPGKKHEMNVLYSETSDPETNITDVIHRELVAETEVICYMSQAPEFKHLLKHPVIVSFLFMKWYRIRWLFFVNLAFYITFFLSLVVYIFTHYAYFERDEKGSFHKFIIHLSWALLLITFFLLVFREMFQIFVAPHNYFQNFENYIEVILIILTGAVLFIKEPTHDTRKQLSSISILLAAFELVLMLGQHPKLSTNVVMLKTVSFNFFKFLLWYSLLILAFALSFYILFAEPPEDREFNFTKPNNEDNEEDLFGDPGKSVFKTIVMLTGEFDASSINFQKFPITSKLIFILFVLMIAIILLNLLNGLAVSDTQMIKNDAELVGHIARAQHIRYVESLLVGNILPINLLNRINSLCCCFPSNQKWNWRVSESLAKRACLFPHYLHYELTIYPNKSGQVNLPLSSKRGWSWLFGKNCSCSCSNVYLDRETIKRTKRVIQTRRDDAKLRDEETYINKLENIIQQFTKTSTNDKMEIVMLNKKLDSILMYLVKTEGEDNHNDK